MEQIKINKIFPNPNQPRKQFDPLKLQELSNSIKENGLMEPIILVRRRDAYMIVAGERRFRACQMVGLKNIPAHIIKANKRKIAELALLENLQREDLNIIEEANGYMQLMEMGMTTKQVAKKMGFKQTWRIQERLNILKLDPLYQECTIKNIITPSQAQELSRLSIEGQQVLFKMIKEGKANPYDKLRSLASAILFKEQNGEQSTFLNEPTKAEIKIKNKYDLMLERLLKFITCSFSTEDLLILKSVVSSSISLNIEKIDMIITHLQKIKKAMIQAETKQEVFG